MVHTIALISVREGDAALLRRLRGEFTNLGGVLDPASGHLKAIDVQGAVNSPRGVAWVPGQTLDYYVRAAGYSSNTGNYWLKIVLTASAAPTSWPSTSRPRWWSWRASVCPRNWAPAASSFAAGSWRGTISRS